MLSLNEASGHSRRLKVCEGNLTLLREKIAREPQSYLAEFDEQFAYFEQQIQLLQLQPFNCVRPQQIDALISLTNFLTGTCHRFPEKCALLSRCLFSVLRCAHVVEMVPELRLAFARSCVRLAMRLVVTLQDTMELLIHLLQFRDKTLRKFILASIVAFIRRCSGTVGRKQKKGAASKKKLPNAFNAQVSSRLKQTLFTMLQLQGATSQPACVRVAQMALANAYRRQFWCDARVANAFAECVFCERIQRVQVCAMRFFLGSSKEEQGEEESDSSSDEEDNKDNRNLREIMQHYKYAKKTRKRKNQMEREKKMVGRDKKTKKKAERLTRSQCNLEAIRSLYDPQKFADRLFGLLNGQKRNEKYVIRLLQISLCARVIGIHKLQTLGFYSYLHRYLQPKQKEVTRLLLYAAQACHEFVPGDIVEQLVRVIAQNFVTDRNSEEAITVGLNTIREIYTNCPDGASEDMVRNLAEYKKMHNKNVSMAAHALIVQLRQTRPHLLHHKDRGRPQKRVSATSEISDEIMDSEEESDEDDGEEEEEDDVEDEEGDFEDDEEIVEMDEGEKAEGEQTEEREQFEQTDDQKEQQEEEKDERGIDGLPRLRDIEHFSKKLRRQTKQERLEQVREGRVDRATAYAKPKKKGPHVGRTNRELAKRKNFKMVQHKVRGRNRQRSFRDRQLGLRAYLLRQQGKKV